MSRTLSLSKQVAYAFGMMGWGILTNLIIVMVPYIYLPPANNELTPLLPQLTWFGVINLLTICISAGRLFDAIYDPLLAQWSDRSGHRLGRRIPFMKFSALPAAFLCALCFFPPDNNETILNAWWLTLTLILFFVSATSYIIPYNAMLPELARTPGEKVRLSILQQAGYVLGIIIAALTNNFAGAIQKCFHYSYGLSVQYAVCGLCALALVLLFIPVLSINEKKYCESSPSHANIYTSIRQSFSNRNFIYYLTADFCYYTALSIITSGLLYYVTVLAGLDRSEGGKFMAIMVAGSLIYYPLIGRGVKKFGKKKIVLAGQLLLSLIFLVIYFLGRLPSTPENQLILISALASFPVAALGVLPTAILAEIATDDAEKTGQNREAMFFAVKYFFVKLGQTLGIAFFAMFTVFGKDPGNDYGLRLNGLCGFALCMLAFGVFSRFKETRG